MEMCHLYGAGTYLTLRSHAADQVVLSVAPFPQVELLWVGIKLLAENERIRT